MNNNEERKVYKLPLAPQDLVEIYKLKEQEDDYVLWVDYLGSKEKLSAEHIIIYLANTNFKTTFSHIDEDLILAYIKSDFMIDAGLLTRFVVMLLKLRFGHEINHLEEELFNMWPKEEMHNFVDKHINLVNELADTIAQIIPFVLCSFYKNLPDEMKAQEIDVKDAVEGIEVQDKPSNIGPNIAKILIDGWDGFLVVCHMLGFKEYYNKAVYNDKPAFFGKDLFFLLTQSNITNNILNIFPPGFIVNHEAIKLKTSEEIIEDIKKEKELEEGDDSSSE